MVPLPEWINTSLGNQALTLAPDYLLHFSLPGAVCVSEAQECWCARLGLTPVHWAVLSPVSPLGVGSWPLGHIYEMNKIPPYNLTIHLLHCPQKMSYIHCRVFSPRFSWGAEDTVGTICVPLKGTSSYTKEKLLTEDDCCLWPPI
jgi:hypothetical protein